MSRRYYSSSAAATTLSSSITSGATSITVGAITGFPVQYPYTLILDPETASEEVVEVTAGSGTTLTVTRGVDNTTALAHTSGAAVKHGVSARDFDEPNAHIEDTSAHGVTGEVVGTTDTQILTNKTLSGTTLQDGVLLDGDVTLGNGSLVVTGANRGLELGASGTANAPLIDFHSGATATDYDARILVTGGNGTDGGGAIELVAAYVSLSKSNACLEIGNPLGASNTPVIDFHSGAVGTDYDVRIVAFNGDGTNGGGGMTLEARGGINLDGPVNLLDESGEVVTKAGAMTLSNKVLASPTVTGTLSGAAGSFSGAVSAGGGFSTTSSVLVDSAGGEITLGYGGSGGLAIAQGNVATHANGVVLWVSGNSLYARHSNGADSLIS